MNNDERDDLPSASIVSRLMNCATSHRMGLLARDKGQEACTYNVWADSGEDMHQAIYNQSDKSLSSDQDRMDFAKTMRKLREFLGEWGATNDDIVIREERLWLHDGVIPIFSGRPDYVRISPNHKRAAIVDFKSMWNRVPDPKENDQLLSQAVLLAFEEPSIETFSLQILSPHYNYTQAVLSAEEVIAYASRLREMLARVNSKTEPVPGDWCKYCPGLLICPAVKKEAADLLKGGISELPSGEAAAKLLKSLVRMKKFIEEVEYHYKEIIVSDPDAVPGWGLSTRVTRTLKNPEKVMNLAAPLIGYTEFWNAVSISLPKLIIAWEKAGQADSEGIMPKAEEMLAPFIVAKESAPSLGPKRKIKTETGENQQ